MFLREIKLGQYYLTLVRWVGKMYVSNCCPQMSKKGLFSQVCLFIYLFIQPSFPLIFLLLYEEAFTFISVMGGQSHQRSYFFLVKKEVGRGVTDVPIDVLSSPFRPLL